MITTTTKVAIHPESEPLFSEHGYTIEIDDEAAGPFIKLRGQSDLAECGTVFIEYQDWPTLRHAIDEMVEQCRKLDNAGKD